MVKLKRRKINSDTERKLLTGMIVSDSFLRDIRLIYHKDLIEVPFVRTVAQWCIDHYDAYSRAPAQELKDLFRGKVRRGEVPEEEQELIEEFLAGLSEEHDHTAFNADYWADEAERYLETKALQNLAEDVQSHLGQGDIKKAREAVQGSRPVLRPTAHAINPLDKDLLKKAFEEAQEPLFGFGGALGQFLNPMFVRESLIGIIAPEKRGKTFLMMEFALQAAKQGCNVVFFSVGDMTETQMARRIAMRLSGRNYMESQCGPVRFPVLDCFINQTQEDKPSGADCPLQTPVRKRNGHGMWMDPEWREDYEPCDQCRKSQPELYRGAHWWKEKVVHHLDYDGAVHAAERFEEVYGERLKMYIYEAGELTCDRIQADLEYLREYHGFVADVVIIDYADVMGVEAKAGKEFRHQQNATWTGLSALRKRWHACFITATQSNRDGYERESLGMSNASEDKRKISHVTAMLAINQTDKEKQAGVARLGLVAARELNFSSARQVHILQCLAMGRPVVGSY